MLKRTRLSHLPEKVSFLVVLEVYLPVVFFCNKFTKSTDTKEIKSSVNVHRELLTLLHLPNGMCAKVLKLYQYIYKKVHFQTFCW